VRSPVTHLTIENNRLDDSVDGLFKITAEIEQYRVGDSGIPEPIVEPDGPIVLTLDAGEASPRLIDNLSKAALQIVRLAFGDFR
jgi:hypothetical protein